jgi:hypothetical protein
MPRTTLGFEALAQFEVDKITPLVGETLAWETQSRSELETESRNMMGVKYTSIYYYKLQSMQ